MKTKFFQIDAFDRVRIIPAFKHIERYHGDEEGEFWHDSPAPDQWIIKDLIELEIRTNTKKECDQ